MNSFFAVANRLFLLFPFFRVFSFAFQMTASMFSLSSWVRIVFFQIGFVSSAMGKFADFNKDFKILSDRASPSICFLSGVSPQSFNGCGPDLVASHVVCLNISSGPRFLP